MFNPLQKFASNKDVALTLLKVQKHSPTILFGAGVVGVVTTVVVASRATLRLSDIVEDTSVKLNKINTLENEEYSPEDRIKDKAIVYTQATMQISKLYAPAFAVGVISIASLTGSHQILTRRNVAISAAYAGAEKALRDYRSRVIESIGPEKEAAIWQPTEKVDAVDGDGKKVKVSVSSEKGGSPYKALFGDHSPNWSKQPEYNQIFLQAQQAYANDRLRSRGYLFLNEVHEMLGLPATKAGQIVGWVWAGDGDNFVDFGIFEDDYSGMRFVTGQERSVWLDFNVDGNVLDILD